MTQSSLDAHDWIEPKRDVMQWRVLRHVAITGPLASSEVEHMLRLRHQTASARLKELEEMGVLSTRYFPRLLHSELPSESRYGLTALGQQLMHHTDAATRLAAVRETHVRVCRDRAQALRDTKRTWAAEVRRTCVETLGRQA